MFKLFKIGFAALFICACAGGVGEETNTIADAPSPDDPKDIPHVSEIPDRDSIISDTPDVPSPRADSNDTHLVVTEPQDSSPIPSVPLPKGTDFSGILYNTNGEILSVALELPSETLETTTDSTGLFTLKNIPDGTYPLIVSSENTDVAYLLQNDKTTKNLLGPVSSSIVSSITASDFKGPPVENIYFDDETPTVGNPQEPEEPDSSDKSDTTIKQGYGNAGYLTVDGNLIQVASNDLPKDVNYGLIKRWNADIANDSTDQDLVGIFYGLSEWTIEVKFELSSIDQTGVYRRNIFGQFNEENSLFSLAIINGVCGTNAPALAFYVGNSNKFSCKSSVISGTQVDIGQTLSVTVTYDGHTLSIYKNGFLIAYNVVSYMFVAETGLPPFVFGDKELNLKLDEIRLGNKTINSADVLYRYYQ